MLHPQVWRRIDSLNGGKANVLLALGRLLNPKSEEHEMAAVRSGWQVSVKDIFMKTARGCGFWLLQGPGWLLVVYLIYSQAIPAFDYELGVAMGTQESSDRITEVGTAFWYGFAFGDLATYIPLLATGLIALWKQMPWARVVVGAALGITVYWPVVSLAVVVKARDAEGWALGDESGYWIVLPVIALWGLWGLCWIARTVSYDASAKS